jgi:hypothetical protein
MPGKDAFIKLVPERSKDSASRRRRRRRARVIGPSLNEHRSHRSGEEGGGRFSWAETEHWLGLFDGNLACTSKFGGRARGPFTPTVTVQHRIAAG